MLFTSIVDILNPDSQPTGTGAQTKTFRIKREPRRIDNIKIRLCMTATATAITGAAWAGVAGMVKEIRVRVADGQTTRNAFQVTGPGLLSYTQFAVSQNVDRETLVGYASTGFVGNASYNYQVTFILPFSDCRLEEPFRHVTGLPLDRLGEDVIVEVDLYDSLAGGSVFTANSPTYHATDALTALITFRDGTESLPYIPIEIRTDTGFAPSTTSNPSYEFSSIGFLSSFLVQTFSAQAADDLNTRSTLLAAGGQFRLEYGRKIVQRTNAAFKVAEQDLLRDVYPNDAAANGTGGVLYARNWPYEYYWDFLKDSPGTAAFSIKSVVNLTPMALAGDKFRLYFNDLAATTRGIHITTHRFLPSSEADLNALMRAI